MKLTPEKLAQWKALVPKLNNDADDHMDVAHSVDMRPEHTANYRHAKNAHEAAYAIHSLIAELREARAKLAGSQALLRKLSPLMINTGYVGANVDIQKALQEVRVGLGKLETPELDAAIAKAAEPLEAKLAEAEKDASNMRKILQLTEQEGEEVVIVYPNPEPLDPSKNFAILVSKDYGDTLTPYRAESLTACLDAAIAAQEKP